MRPLKIGDVQEQRRLKCAGIFRPLFKPARYKVFWGGRGSGKSWHAAMGLIMKAHTRKVRIGCFRELQNSIKDSVHKLLSDQIVDLGLSPCFEVTKDSIRSKVTGSEFLFKGLRHNAQEVKSTEGIDIAWVEEAQLVSKDSWEMLIPTIRKDGSEIWVTFNPDQESDSTYQRFVVNTPPNSVVVRVNWDENPWFPRSLEAERQYMLATDPDAYQNIWEGSCRTSSDAQILKGKYRVEAFEVVRGETNEWDGPYFGADWGFSQDPTVLVKLWIRDQELYVEHEEYGIGVELDDIPAMFKRIPEADKYVIRADNSRPETISYVSRAGMLQVEAAEKWSGSVEDGVAFLRSFRGIIIHPRCKHALEEARLYSYKKDRLTGDILPTILDKHNHMWDAVRYALEPMIGGNEMAIWIKLGQAALAGQ